MLADTPEVAIKEIAYTLGYHHTSSFTRAFEHAVGESPTDYRKHELQKKWRAAVTANKKHKRLTP
jgi:AraC-like DNA-binding protein